MNNPQIDAALLLGFQPAIDKKFSRPLPPLKFALSILEDRTNLLPRLMYADWLQEQGDDRHELIRLRCEIESMKLMLSCIRCGGTGEISNETAAGIQNCTICGGEKFHSKPQTKYQHVEFAQWTVRIFELQIPIVNSMMKLQYKGPQAWVERAGDLQGIALAYLDLVSNTVPNTVPAPK